MKRMLGLILFAFISTAGVAHAQSAAAPNGTATTKPAMPMPMMPGMTDRVSGESSSMTAGELATIGVGAVAGVVLFQGAMWHGMVVMGAVIGGYVGDYIYSWHNSGKTAS